MYGLRGTNEMSWKIHADYIYSLYLRRFNRRLKSFRAIDVNQGGGGRRHINRFVTEPPPWVVAIVLCARRLVANSSLGLFAKSLATTHMPSSPVFGIPDASNFTRCSCL